MLISTKSFSFLAGSKKRTKKQKKQKTKQNKTKKHHTVPDSCEVISETHERIKYRMHLHQWLESITGLEVWGSYHAGERRRGVGWRGGLFIGGEDRGEANIQPARLLRQTSPENPFHKTPRKPQRLLVFAVVWRDCVNTSETVSHWQTEEGGNHVNRYKMQITTELFHL